MSIIKSDVITTFSENVCNVSYVAVYSPPEFLVLTRDYKACSDLVLTRLCNLALPMVSKNKLTLFSMLWCVIKE